VLVTAYKYVQKRHCTGRLKCNCLHDHPCKRTMASVPGFSPYPLWSPQNHLGIITESVFALLILCLGPSGSRLFPSCSSRWSPVNQCVRPRVLGLNKIPWTSLGSANSPRSPLTTLLQPFRPEARIPATCTASRKKPKLLRHMSNEFLCLQRVVDPVKSPQLS
jgi:hypothetical protein